MPSDWLDWTHRRTKISTASAMPSSSASPPSRSSPSGSRSAIGPSTTRCTTSGTPMLTAVPRNAATSESVNCHR